MDKFQTSSKTNNKKHPNTGTRKRRHSKMETLLWPSVIPNLHSNGLLLRPCVACFRQGPPETPWLNECTIPPPPPPRNSMQSHVTPCQVPHRDFGGGAYERADAGGRVGFGTQPTNPLVLAGLDSSVQVVRVELVNPARTRQHVQGGWGGRWERAQGRYAYMCQVCMYNSARFFDNDLHTACQAEDR